LDRPPHQKEEHLTHLKAKQDTGGKFVAVSWIAKFIYKNINYEWIICPLTPLIITPLFLDTNPKQAATLIANRGDKLAWGLITNAKRPTLGFQAKV
jgi:hypothetical protein